MNNIETTLSGKRALFLYTELAGYTMACLRAAADRGLDVHAVRWPVNVEAPFAFEENHRIQLYNRSDFDTESLLKLVEEVEPQIILSSGWIDLGYVKLCRRLKGKIPTVLLLDNQWKGTWKQRVAATISSVTIKSAFSHCWVPGQRQFQYALKLKFPENHIETGFYSADVRYFSQLFRETFSQKEQSFPKRFLYVGRYAEFKGISELWSAFVEFRAAGNQDWELWCAGTGDMYEQRMQSDGIKHLGFVQPAEMRQIIAETGVFVLPSRKEPWGVVVHEFAAAGFPLLCSRAVGASEAFVKPDLNGILHQPENRKEILKGMYFFANRTNKELCDMGEQSHKQAQKITPDNWSETLAKFLPK